MRKKEKEKVLTSNSILPVSPKDIVCPFKCFFFLFLLVVGIAMGIYLEMVQRSFVSVVIYLLNQDCY